MKHFVRSTLLAVSLFSVPVLAEPADSPTAKPAEETLTLSKGASKDLTIPSVIRIAIGDPAIADATLQGGNVIRIEGKKAGQTTVLIWTSGNVRKAYRVVVQ